VFIRELLQNARDAGATRVAFTIEREAGRDRIRCRDDGCGMTFEHARRYLFTLYASSKRHQKGTAGRFGIGFWSVLRFDPETISVRSRPAGGEGWEVVLDGSLDSATVAPCVMLPGTEIVLERRAEGGTFDAEVLRAIRGDARFLRLRDDPERSLEVTVNGRPVMVDFGLPPPSLEFRQPGLRGAVALSVEPGVEVFAHGLRVRRAAFLDELLTGGSEDRRRSAELPDGLMPRVLLDSDDLRVLMARSEAREDRTLRRLVARARRELARLVRIELDRQAPRGRVARGVEWIAAAFPARPVRWIGGAIALGSLAGALVGVGLRGTGRPLPGDQRAEMPSNAPLPRSVTSSFAAEPRNPYRDIASLYGGPTVDTLDHQSAVDLVYRPSSASPLFAALRVAGLDAAGRPWKEPAGDELVPYHGSPCAGDCLEVAIRVAAFGGVLRLPVAAGFRVDPTSVRLDGEAIEVHSTPAGEPAVLLERDTRGTLVYLSAPSSDVTDLPVGRWPPLPDVVVQQADRLLALPVPQRVEQAADWVRSRVVYDRSSVEAALHDDAALNGIPLFERTIVIGAGDCDVQNALLAAILGRAGVPSRLAVGFVGSDGRAAPGLHAWVEYLESNVWRVADASTSPERHVRPAPRSPAAPTTDGVTGSDDRVAAHVVPSASSRADGGARYAAAIAALAIALVLAVSYRFRAMRREGWTRRVTASDAGADVARLLRGALLRPKAYAHVAALYSRPLVPTVGGGSLSLRRSQRLARSGRLYRSHRETRLARQAARRGVPVIDASRDEGRAVADLLGARDLDGWDGLLETAHSTPLTGLVESAARRCGERWLVRVAPDAPSPVAVHEGEPLGLARAIRVVVLAETGRLWRAAEELDGRLGRAALLLATAVTDELEISPSTRLQILSHLAQRTVGEQLR
jgi:hypothetical protein